MESITQRIFFAIALNPTFKKLLSETIRELQKHPKGYLVKWHPVDKLHITVRFLGEVKTADISILLPQIEQNLALKSSFPVQLGKAITLPKKHPRLLAISIPISFELADLFQRLEQILIATGFTPEKRPFFPHITLGRSHNEQVPWEDFKSKIIFPEVSPQQVTEITLLRSEFHPEGNVYVPIKRFLLG